MVNVNAPRDILIIEDNASALNSFGSLIETHLDIKPFLASTPKHALDIIKTHPLKVIITDQELESDMTGVEIAERVKQDGLPAQFIMLTGQADAKAVDKALNIGYFKIVRKQNIDQLTEAVRAALLEYAVRQPTAHVDKRLSWKWKPLCTVATKLTRVHVIEDRVVNEDEWAVRYEAAPDVKTTQTIKATHVVRTRYETSHESKTAVKSELSFKKLIPLLGSKLEHQYSSQIASKETFEEELTLVGEQSIEVKETSLDPDREGRVLRTRKYETAPTYTRIGGTLHIECSGCEAVKEHNFYIDFPRYELATRQVDYYQGGEIEVTNTGYMKVSIIGQGTDQ